MKFNTNPSNALQLAGVFLAAGLLFADATATHLIVPDHASTIQSALNARPDTVFLRPASYSETPVVSYPVVLMSLELQSQKPALAGLRIHIALNRSSALYAFQRIRCAGAVEIVSDNGSCDLGFTDCDLQAGLADYSSYGDTRTISLLKCRLGGFIDLWATSAIHIDSCQVTGEVRANGAGPDLSVQGCVFEGNGTGVALRGERLTTCDIIGNEVRHYSSGLAAGGDYTTIRDNTVEDCWTTGIGAGVLLVTVDNNVVHGCGRGIVVETSRRGTLTRNNIATCTSEGIYIIWGDEIEVVENVVWGCASDGVLIRGAGSQRVSMKGNTIGLNGGSACVVEDSYSREGQEWNGNIGYENGGYGVHWLSGGSANFSCNDWFGNQQGAVEGRPPSGEDFSVDPQLCIPDSGDFRLNSASPLVDRAGCGQIGALGVGCGVTPTLVQRFTAKRVTGGVQVVWQVAEGATASEVWVERAEAVEGEGWIRPVTERAEDNQVVVELDRSAESGRGYWYRLTAQEGSETVVIGAAISVEAQARLEFRLLDVGPNPGSGLLGIAFALPRAAYIEIAVFDIQGRRVASLARGAWPEGTHEVKWNGRTRAGETASAGMYFLRYTYPGGQDRRALVRMR